MAITTIAGVNTYPIAIASATTGAAGSETPDGNVVYLNPQNWDVKHKNDIKRKTTTDGASGYGAGKRDIQATLTNCRVVAAVAANSTAELNLITDFFNDFGVKPQSSKCYLFIKHIANNVYEKLSWNSSDLHLQYLKGFVMQFDWNCEKGKVYSLNVVFGEVTTP